MFKKRLLAFGLAGVMVMGLNMSVLAAGETNPTSKDSTVTVTVPEKYIITIPGTLVAQTTAATDIFITVDEAVNLAPNRTLKVKIADPEIKFDRDDDTEVEHKTVAKLQFTPTSGTTADLEANAVVASFLTQTSINLTEGRLSIPKITTTDLLAGQYTGHVTFSIGAE